MVPEDSLIEEKEKEQLTKLQDFRRDVDWLWSVNVTVIQAVVGALGMVTKNLQWGLQQKRIDCENGIPAESAITWNHKNCLLQLVACPQLSNAQ